MTIEPPHNDVTALDQPDRSRRRGRQRRLQDLADPWAGRVDQNARPDFAELAGALVLQRQRPGVGVALCAYATRAGRDDGALVGGVARVQNDKPRVFGPAVGIFEAQRIFPLQRLAGRVVGQIQRAGRRQQAAAAQMIVKKQAEPQQPGGAQALVVRQDELQRPDDVRRDLPENFALDQRLAHQTETEMLEIAHAAVNQFARRAGGRRCEIVFFAKEHRPAAARRVAGDAAPVDAAADHRDIEWRSGGRRGERPFNGGVRRRVHGGVPSFKKAISVGPDRVTTTWAKQPVLFPRRRRKRRSRARRRLCRPCGPEIKFKPRHRAMGRKLAPAEFCGGSLTLPDDALCWASAFSSSPWRANFHIRPCAWR